MPKPKYSSIAHKERFCELCQEKLEKEEVIVCKQCMLVGGAAHD